MTDFSFIRDSHTRAWVSNGYKAVSQLELMGWLKIFKPEDGMVLCLHKIQILKRSLKR